MKFAVTLPPQAALPIVGSDALFPVRRVYCVGRNYAEHAREMGHDPQAEPPFFFQKCPDNLRTDGRFVYPPLSRDVHHEIELLVGLRAGGSNIDPAVAGGLVWGYGVALDMTRRDLQAEAKKLGRPWDAAKAFDGSAPCSALVPAERVGGVLTAGEISLDVNGERRQTGDLGQMIWDIPHLIAHLSRLFRLAAGDVILTGTPAGVGPVAIGDRLVGRVQGIGELAVVVEPPA
jgi:fumarylpyruvate hydrolase